MFGFGKSPTMPDPAAAPAGRDAPLATAETHYVNGRPLQGPYPADTEQAMFGLGCFWGAERLFWETPGVYLTAAGYAGGYTPNPTYDEVCTGRTGHNEVVLVVFRPAETSYEALLGVFFEAHDPTQGMRQGNDVGTQYRSGVYCYGPDQLETAQAAKAAYEASLREHRLGTITTEVVDAPTFYFAEEYHQQYLAKVPHGYCGLSGTGVAFCVAEEAATS